jgi:ABC-type transporter Mla maintaining outer membrane lipid asymmetry permease subunit MlaE
VAGIAWGHAAEPSLAARVHAAPERIGPAVALLLLAAPLGAAQAGEIGALRLGDQLAWLRASGRSVFAHVVLARVLAVAIVAPLAALLAAFALLGVAALDGAPPGAAVASLASVTPGRVLGGAARAAAGGGGIAAIACAVGLLSHKSVAQAAARGAAAALVAAAGLGIAWLARSVA